VSIERGYVDERIEEALAGGGGGVTDGNKTITTAITSGVLSYTYQFDYSWE
jgi:alcohol dehydrogenase YqhD (iron-dependent ADH family)